MFKPHAIQPLPPEYGMETIRRPAAWAMFLTYSAEYSRNPFLRKVRLHNTCCTLCHMHHAWLADRQGVCTALGELGLRISGGNQTTGRKAAIRRNRKRSVRPFIAHCFVKSSGGESRIPWATWRQDDPLEINMPIVLARNYGQTGTKDNNTNPGTRNAM